MGSIARVEVFYTDLYEWLSRQQDTGIYASALNGKEITTMQKIREGIIVIGNESRGISTELMGLAKERITIPGKGEAESLNAAVATGIILSHLLT
jgi:RNA methyltransferase, TrmH family